MPIALCGISLPNGHLRYANDAFLELFKVQPHALSTHEQWLAALPDPEQRDLAQAAWRRALETAANGEQQALEPVELTLGPADGEPRVVQVSGVIHPKAGWALLTFVDLTSRGEARLPAGEAAQLARESELLSSVLLDHSHEMIVIAPGSGRRHFVSPGVQEITGWSQAEYVDLELDATVHPDDLPTVNAVRRKVLDEGAKQRLRFRTLVKEGGHRWVEALVAPYLEAGAARSSGYVLTLRDIAKQKEQEDSLAQENMELAQLAQVDELTGIANRRMFKTALSREARRMTRSTQSLAVLLLDVDNFKKYNDLYGHLQGDACLRQVAQTLKQALHRVADLVARYGGEEFVMLLPMTEPGGAERVAQNVLEAVAALRIPHAATPYGIVTLSAGVSTWPATVPMDEERFLEEADRALYRAKNQGRNRFCVNHYEVPAGAAVCFTSQPGG